MTTMRLVGLLLLAGVAFWVGYSEGWYQMLNEVAANQGELPKTVIVMPGVRIPMIRGDRHLARTLEAAVDYREEWEGLTRKLEAVIRRDVEEGLDETGGMRGPAPAWQPSRRWCPGL